MASIDLTSPAAGKLIRDLARKCGLEVPASRADVVTVSPVDDLVNIVVAQPRVYRTIELDGREVSYGPQRFYDLLTSKFRDALAELRGLAFREALDTEERVEFVGAEELADGTAVEHVERMAVRLADESQRLMAYAAELRAGRSA